MSEKRTKFDKLQRNVERLAKRDEAFREKSASDEERPEPAISIELDELIRQRAYELYEARGREHGHAVENWLQAEAEIRAAMPPGKLIPFRPVQRAR